MFSGMFCVCWVLVVEKIVRGARLRTREMEKFNLYFLDIFNVYCVGKKCVYVFVVY